MIKKRLKADTRILVVLPTLGKRPDLLRQTLSSIVAQKPISFDLVMIFSLKDKETRSLADEFGAVSIDDPGSLSGALNIGIALAKPAHEFISWIGDDDLLAPNSFQTCIQSLDSHPDAALAFGYCDYIDSNGRYLFTSRAGALAPWLMTWGPNLVPCPGILFRRSALANAGEFDVNNKYSMDLDMLLRLRKIGKLVNTKKVLASFRWHATSITVTNRSAALQEAAMVKKRYLSKFIRPLMPIWDYPLRIVSKFASKRVDRLAHT